MHEADEDKQLKLSRQYIGARQIFIISLFFKCNAVRCPELGIRTAQHLRFHLLKRLTVQRTAM